MIRVRCGCGNKAEYAVYEYPNTQPHCLMCMLEAVDVAISIPVRTLDPWEMEKPEPKPSNHKYLFNRRNVKC